MAIEPKVLFQSAPAAATLTALPAVSVGSTMTVTSLLVCNRDAAATSFRIAVDKGGTGVEDKDYIYYDVAIDGNDTFGATIGLTLEENDVIRVYATLATLSFNFFGVEEV